MTTHLLLLYATLSELHVYRCVYSDGPKPACMAHEVTASSKG